MTDKLYPNPLIEGTLNFEDGGVVKIWPRQSIDSDQLARRLAACWNACHGLPADMLETALSEAMIAMRQQRNELLAACKAALESAKHDDYQLVTMLRAAIEKAGGK